MFLAQFCVFLIFFVMIKAIAADIKYNFETWVLTTLLSLVLTTLAFI